MRPRTTTTVTGFLLAATLAALAGCGADLAAAACDDGRCDEPGRRADRECLEGCGLAGGRDPATLDADERACYQPCRAGRALEHCQDRRADALLPARRAFTSTAIRWACADVDGVDGDDRGQEYCEYVATIAAPPGADGVTPAPRDVGRPGDAPLRLDDAQRAALAADPDAAVGQCLFTSWHADLPGELPACGGDPAGCPEQTLSPRSRPAAWLAGPGLGVRLTAARARMRQGFNENAAAADLAAACLVGAGEPVSPGDPREDDFVRGCMGAHDTFGTEWRRSDAEICAAMTRAAECGCGLDTSGDGVADVTSPEELARALVPRQPGEDGAITLRGFPLGTWSRLGGAPPRCHQLEPGDGSRVLMACDLTAADVLAAPGGDTPDLVQTCRTRFGDAVVVHVPIPAADLICHPPADGAFAATCGDLVPWTAAD